MSKIRNTRISCLYLAKLVNAQHKKLKPFAVLVYAPAYIIVAILRSHFYDFSLIEPFKQWLIQDANGGKERLTLHITAADGIP